MLTLSSCCNKSVILICTPPPPMNMCIPCMWGSGGRFGGLSNVEVGAMLGNGHQNYQQSLLLCGVGCWVGVAFLMRKGGRRICVHYSLECVSIPKLGNLGKALLSTFSLSVCCPKRRIGAFRNPVCGQRSGMFTGFQEADICRLCYAVWEPVRIASGVG